MRENIDLRSKKGENEAVLHSREKERENQTSEKR